MKPKHHIFVLINARRWRDGSGNTYYVAKARFIIGESISETFCTPITYGYGDAYRSETLEWLKTQGILPDDRLPSDSDTTVLTSVSDVATRRELVMTGELM